MGDKGNQAEYPVEALGPVLAAAVAAGVDATFVPVSIAAQCCLAAISLAGQGHFDVELPTGQRRPTSLSLVTIAESGDRKSACDDYMMAPVWAFQEKLEDDFQARKANTLIEQSAWDEAKKQATQTHKKGGQAALAQAYRDLGPRPEGPPDPTIVMRSGTTQALVKRYISGRPSMGLMSDEGGSWLGGYGMTPDNQLLTISLLSDFWDGRAVQINTVGEGFTALKGRRLAFHLMIQPFLAGRLLGNAEAQGQGFLSRLLVAAPESKAGSRFVDPDRRQSPEHRAAIGTFRERLSTIISAPLPMVDDTPVLKPEPVIFSDQAKAMWWAFYNALEARLGPEGDLKEVKGFVGKLPEQAARLAVNLAAFEQGARLRELDAPTLARGIQLAEFYLSEAVRLFGKPSTDPLMADAQLLSDWLREKWTENLISAKAIAQFGPSRLRRGGDHIAALIDVLVRHEHLSDQLPGGGMVSGAKVRKAWRLQMREARNG
ncbi:hypothetical protein BWQ93_05845 [Sphingopyxis sp. QXT-31]|nr:hypothetical protein BWQ93_05845 [Sphingopyxis sp. QXT-31]